MLKKKKENNVINLKKDKYFKRGKLFYIIFSLIIVGVLAVSGVTIWLVSTLVGKSSGYLVSFEQVAGGEIIFDSDTESPNSKNIVSGSDQTVTIIPDSEHYLKSLIINDEIVDVENYGHPYLYAITNIDKTYVISALFDIKDFGRITITKTGSGTVSPSSVSCKYGTSQTFTITPDEGQKIESIIVDGVAVDITASEGGSQTYSFENIQEDHSVIVAFVSITYWVTVNQTNNGKISPISMAKYYGTNQTFTITPSNIAYRISALIIDGKQVAVENNGEAYEYTFTNIKENHTISAVYILREFAVTFLGYNDEIIDEQLVRWNYSATAPDTSEITLPEGYHFSSWTEDLHNVRSDRTIRANFAINTYDVIFKKSDGTETLFTKTYSHGSILSEVAPDGPTITGYRFNTWLDENQNEVNTITSEATVYAQYVQQCDIVINYEYPFSTPHQTTTIVDINTNKELIFTPNSGYVLESITIDGETETISNTEYTALYFSYATGESFTRTLENISDNITITLKFSVGPGIVSKGWVYQIIDDNYYIIGIPDSLEKIGNNYFIPSKILAGTTVHDVYGIGNGSSSLQNRTNYYIEDGITIINNNAFENCSALTTITIPASVMTIGSRVFANCTNLTTVIFGDDSQLLTLGSSAFYDCLSLTSITMPKNITSIGDAVFSSCSSLTSITIPASVTSIGGYAFSYCTKLTTIIFENNSQLATIGNEAFYRCEKLEAILIPSNVTSIGTNAFAYCSAIKSIVIISPTVNILDKFYISSDSLQSIAISSENIHHSSLDGVLFSKDGTTLIRYPIAKLGDSYIIPETVTSISEWAFYECDRLKAITIPSNITSIDGTAFLGCSNLEIINVNSNINDIFNKFSIYSLEPNKLKEINISNNDYYSSENGILFNADKTELLKYPDAKIGDSYTIPETVTSIKDSAFKNCLNLKEITIPGNVTSIGWYAFYNCISLNSVTFNDDERTGVDRVIWDSAFKDCINLTTVNISAKGTAIYQQAFKGCEKLANLNIVGVYYINYEAFQSCLNLTSIIIPGSVESIGSSAFENCFSLNSVTFNDDGRIGINRIIRDSAFKNCINLTTVNISAKGTAIYQQAFKGCEKLANLNIVGVYYINYEAFEDCVSLVSISLPEELQDIGQDVFKNCDALTNINVSNNNTTFASIDGVLFNKDLTTLIRYPSAKLGTLYTIPSTVSTIASTAFQNCTNLVEIVLPEGITNISMDLFSGCSSLTSIIIPASVTHISSGAFEDCINLETVTFTENSLLTTIRQSAFKNCVRLTTITLPTGITIIGDSAFENCSALTEITIPASVVTIGSRIFANCTNLIEIIFEGNSELENISNYAFFECTNLTTLLNMPNSIAYIGAYSFYNTKITIITIPESVTIIGENAFSDCADLATVIFGNNSQLTTIEAYAFSGCSGLTSIILPAISTLGDYAFNDCSNLTNVNFVAGATITSLNQTIFYGCTNLTTIAIPASLTTIESGTFRNFTNLTTVIFEDNSQLETISDSAFSGCTNLKEIRLPSSITSIGEFAFDNLEILILYFYTEIIPTCQGNTFGENLAAICVNGLSLEGYKTSWTTFVDCIYPILTPTDFEYEIEEGTNDLVIININSMYDRYFIESEYEISGITYYVKKIGNGIDCVDLNVEDVFLADGIETIADYAFYNSRLANITMRTISSIGNYAFAGCGSITSIDLNSHIMSIGDYAFDSCFGLKNVNMVDGLISIGEQAFSYCFSLISIDLPSTVAYIGDYAFYGCQNLKTFVIYSIIPPAIGIQILDDSTNIICVPGGCLNIYREAWTDYSYYISYEILNINEITYEIISGTNEIIITDINTTKRAYYINNKYIINDEIYLVKSVGRYEENNSLIDPNAVSVCFANGIEYIGKGIFKNSNKLLNIIILSGTICDEAFYGCTTLISVVLGNDVIEIREKAFYGCTNLIYINIEDASIESIGNYAFYGCTSLTTINLPDITELSAGLFQGSGLVSIVIPESVTSIGHFAFADCINLETLSVPENITWNLDIVDGCHNLKNLSTPWRIPNDFGLLYNTRIENLTILSGLTEVDEHTFWWGANTLITLVLPSSVTSIASNAFKDFKKLKSINIPDSVTNIGASAFSGCESLESIVIPDGITAINGHTFRNTKLTSIIIPASVKKILVRAFLECSSLTEMTVLSTTPPTLGAAAISSAVTVIYVPSASIDLYRSAWANYSNLFVAID